MPLTSSRIPIIAAALLPIALFHQAMFQQPERAVSIEEGVGLALRDARESLVLFTFSDGSQLGVPVHSVLRSTARRLSVGGVDPELIIHEQLVPALEDDPALLLDLARVLSFDDIFLLATQVHMNTPGIMLRELYAPTEARLAIAVAVKMA